MSDDIVTRLRMQAELTDAFPTMKAKDIAPTTWLNEAADEIERLRADRDRWRDLAEYLCQTVPSVVVPNEIASRFPDPMPVQNGL